MAQSKKNSADATRHGTWTSEVRPAPGNLKIVQAFVNTAGFGDRAEELTNPWALTNWLEHWRLADAETRLGEADLERAIEVRTGLRALILADNHGAKIAEKTVVALDRATAAAPLVVRFSGDGTDRFEPAAAGLDGAIARLAGIVSTARLEGVWPRLKICSLETCRRVFYDASKIGRFCTKRCSDRVHARAYRRRKK